ncbi:hypothetical protein [Runella salmonicolor]|uniref:Outer membrane protein beta-barrel domain-containing protein n=1 Tax=Runella salmonicolor TaxID=2950278 RepID=A0ABT1FLR0_9BACT|nr:hypothetical protein [Runella salmonicolor]MCP1382701.1 hypothetical protein [Runella salmonicolor]
MNKTKPYLLLVLILLAGLTPELYAQNRNWKAFQIGWGIHRSQILNVGFNKLVQDGKISSAYGLNVSTSYIVNPIIIRANFFTEQFQTDDVNYIYNSKETKLRGYEGLIGFNMIPHTHQILNIACGYKYSILGSFDESSKIITSKILKFPYWGLGFTSNPQNRLSISINYSHPLTLTQEDYSQISLNVYLNLH